ncbi:MAG: hypothetical protein JXB10_10375 [Pirellulales bacterium]|nr:hypothetical protein [Pirellulales bacterium]
METKRSLITLESPMVRIFTAFYDPSQSSKDGSFWSWHSPDLDRNLLVRFYYDVAAAGIPEDPNQLTHQTVIGGIAQVTPSWACVWRFGNGGRDVHGRPGRFVLFAAFVAREETDGVDISSLLTCKVVNDILDQSLTACPVPLPAALECDIPLQQVRGDPIVLEKVLREGQLELTGKDAFVEAGVICANLPADRLWICRVRAETGGISAVIDCPIPNSKLGGYAPEDSKKIPEDSTISGSPPRIQKRKPHQSLWILGPAIAVCVLFIIRAILGPIRSERGVQEQSNGKNWATDMPLPRSSPVIPPLPSQKPPPLPSSNKITSPPARSSHPATVEKEQPAVAADARDNANPGGDNDKFDPGQKKQPEGQFDYHP